MKSNKVLILVPSPKIAGGVSNYYKVLKPYLGEEFSYMVRGRRLYLKRFDILFLFFCYALDYIIFLCRIPFYKQVVINHSLSKDVFVRDLLYLRISKIFNKKVSIFFRGLDPKIQQLVDTGGFPSFKTSFFKADRLIVLSSAFKKKIKSWGYSGEIIEETTIVDPSLLTYNHTEVVSKSNKRILFLSRVEKYKGVYELLDAFIALHEKHNDYELIIAGDGGALADLKEIVIEKGLKNIVFLGHIEGEKKARVLFDADLFVFPSYAEGMPNAILEAMAFGLPIITSNVGGIPDIFTDGKNGYMTSDISPTNLENLMCDLLGNEKLMSDFSENNKISSKQFFANNVAHRLTKIFFNEI